MLLLDGNYTFARAGGRLGREVAERMGNRKGTIEEPHGVMPIDGVYTIKGTQPSDPGHPKAATWAYEGLLEVAYQSATSGYMCTWSVGSDEYQGIGLRSQIGLHHYLAVGWGDASYGIARYWRATDGGGDATHRTLQQEHPQGPEAGRGAKALFGRRALKDLEAGVSEHMIASSLEATANFLPEEGFAQTIK